MASLTSNEFKAVSGESVVKRTFNESLFELKEDSLSSTYFDIFVLLLTIIIGRVRISSIEYSSLILNLGDAMATNSSSKSFWHTISSLRNFSLLIIMSNELEFRDSSLNGVSIEDRFIL